MEIKRDYLQKLIDRIDNQLIKIITGVIRCGKSYLLNKIFKNYIMNNGIDEVNTPEKVQQEQKSLLNVETKKIIIVGDNIKSSLYDNGIILMSIMIFF